MSPRRPMDEQVFGLPNGNELARLSSLQLGDAQAVEPETARKRLLAKTPQVIRAPQPRFGVMHCIAMGSALDPPAWGPLPMGISPT